MAKEQSFKKKLISHLEKYELYFRFKYSSFVYSFLKKRNPKLQNVLDAELRLYQSALMDMPANALVFDIGANLGYTLELFDKIGCRVIAVEPDLINLNCIRARHSNKKNVTIIPMAVSDTEGEATLYLQDDGDSLHTLSDKWKNYLENPLNDRWKNLLVFSKKRVVQTTTLEALQIKYGAPYYIKIDVEGYEEEVIKGLKTPVSLISFEANLPQFLNETIRSMAYLDTLSKVATFNYSSYDKLELPQFVTRDEIVHIIKNTPLRCIDIFCKM